MLVSLYMHHACLTKWEEPLCGKGMVNWEAAAKEMGLTRGRYVIVLLGFVVFFALVVVRSEGTRKILGTLFGNGVPWIISRELDQETVCLDFCISFSCLLVFCGLSGLAYAHINLIGPVHAWIRELTTNNVNCVESKPPTNRTNGLLFLVHLYILGTLIYYVFMLVSCYLCAYLFYVCMCVINR